MNGNVHLLIQYRNEKPTKKVQRKKTKIMTSLLKTTHPYPTDLEVKSPL